MRYINLRFTDFTYLFTYLLERCRQRRPIDNSKCCVDLIVNGIVTSRPPFTKFFTEIGKSNSE